MLSKRMEPYREDFRDYLTYDFTKADALLKTHDPTLDELGITGPLAERLAARKLTTLKSIERYDEIEYVKGVGPEGAARVTEAIRNWRLAHGDELWRVCARVEALTDLDYSDFLSHLPAAAEPALDYYRQHRVAGLLPISPGLVSPRLRGQHAPVYGTR